MLFAVWRRAYGFERVLLFEIEARLRGRKMIGWRKWQILSQDRVDQRVICGGSMRLGLSRKRDVASVRMVGLHVVCYRYNI
jgi:hypothetical protein